MKILFRFVVAAAIVAANMCSGARADVAAPVLRLCNGSSALCSRRYNEITFPGTHNAMSNRDEEWTFPNQEHSVEAQLESGVRAVNLDLYIHRGEPYTCHSYCNQGNRKLSDTLAGMKKFIDSHPDEVVTLYLEDSAGGASALESTFANSGILKYALEQKPGAPWPTIEEMLDAGKRLVIIGNDGGRPWYLSNSDFLWSSPWDFRRIKDFRCGTPQAVLPLYMMQHFILNPYPMEIYAKKANRKKVIMDRAFQCWRETGQRPNVIIVDFASLGDIVEAAAELNGFTSPPPAQSEGARGE